MFVAFQNRSTNEVVMIEPLARKPAGKTVKDWLADVKQATNLNPEIKSEWVTLGGEKALKTINRSPDSKESENLYVVHQSKTFADSGPTGTPLRTRRSNECCPHSDS